MLENTIAIAASTCSNLDAFTTTTTDARKETQGLGGSQICATPEPAPDLQAQ